MEKILFKNGEAPYISANNLNTLQSNIENAINNSEMTLNSTISTLQDNVDELETNANTELDKKLNISNKASVEEVKAGIDDTKYTTSLGIKNAIEDALSSFTRWLWFNSTSRYRGNTY